MYGSTVQHAPQAILAIVLPLGVDPSPEKMLAKPLFATSHACRPTSARGHGPQSRKMAPNMCRKPPESRSSVDPSPIRCLHGEALLFFMSLSLVGSVAKSTPKAPYWPKEGPKPYNLGPSIEAQNAT